MLICVFSSDLCNVTSLVCVCEPHDLSQQSYSPGGQLPKVTGSGVQELVSQGNPEKGCCEEKVPAQLQVPHSHLPPLGPALAVGSKGQGDRTKLF